MVEIIITCYKILIVKSINVKAKEGKNIHYKDYIII